MARNYDDAVASLNTLQTNFAILNAIKTSGRKLNRQAIPEMIEWCRKIGYQPSDFDRLNSVHIAGTKGKGSTSAFVSSILTQFLGAIPDGSDRPLSKIGLYTSPHLRFVRERIQINGKPLSEEQFSRYFFETWDRLENAAEENGQDPKSPEAKPVYFRFLTLMAFHTYMSEGVDAAIIECGVGGAHDSTNVIQRPAVTGITSLGIDHVGALGETLPEIAWHKAGIIKKGAACYTPSSQLSDAKVVLDRIASEVGSDLIYTDIDPRIASGEIKLGLAAEFQKTNATLALAMAKDWLERRGLHTHPAYEAMLVRGLRDVKWPGRCDTRYEKGLTWFIDGGHTLESIQLAGQWYASTQIHGSTTQSPTPVKSTKKFLIFNQQTRDAQALARALYTTLSTTLKDTNPFTHVIFCTNTTFKNAGYKPDLMSAKTDPADVEALKVQNQLAKTWQAIDEQADVTVVTTIEGAVEIVRGASQQSPEPVTALVTGSIHLVGGFLEVFESSTGAS